MQKETISLGKYPKNLFFTKLERSKEEYKNGKVQNARDVFKELRDKYGY